MSLKEYKSKRNFEKTKEPKGKELHRKKKKMFVIQKHHASHLHYDFRLELDGVLKSWAVPKGPSLNPKDKRLAVEVEDHPIEYAKFEGEIPKGEYGGGHVIVWDRGEWIPPEDAEEQLKKGRLKFELHGQKLGGEWLLLRTKLPGAKKNNWLLIKANDEAANSKKDILKEDKSVISGISLEALEEKYQELPSSKKSSQKKGFKKTKLLSFEDIGGVELATLSEVPPQGEDWIHEIKYDGYRTLCLKNKKSIKLLTRSGLNWTKKYHDLEIECKKIKADSVVLDGEIVWLDEKGVSQFHGLQDSLEEKKSADLLYYVFDLLYLNGFDLRGLPLLDRKKLLKEILENSDTKKVLFSEHWQDAGKDVLLRACSNQLEGIISKNIKSHYSSGRNRNWIKTKCTNIQEFVIGGYCLQKNNKSLGSLLMGAKNSSGELQYLGRVGTGFNQNNSKKLLNELKKLQVKESSFDVKSPKNKDIIWVKPRLVANVHFGAWTKDKILRHAAFKGLREDKKAKDVTLDEDNGKKKLKEFELSHPEKIIYPAKKITKQDLANYYQEIQKWMLPHLKDRPLALLRCPHGQGKECFFQKHIETDGKGILGYTAFSKLKNKKEQVLSIDSLLGLLELVQIGTMEIHIRGCQREKIDYPNQIVFDFDPDIGVSFQKVKEAAFLLKKLLSSLKLKSFVKVSGGKGLHVHVPIAPFYDWDQVKAFSKSICEQMETMHPKEFTTNMSKSKRKGKIFLDYLRNSFGASAIAPYSVRNHAHASVALPISWIEVKKLKKADSYTLLSVPKILKKRSDPWKGYNRLKQKIVILDRYNNA